MPFLPPKGPQRDRLSDAVVAKIEPHLPRIKDDRRRRPLYFDGRFLAARDLTREQDYFLARQADLGRAGGFGVVAGLVASEQDGRIVISAGHGVTPSGEMVVLSEQLVLDPRQALVSETVRVRLGVSRAIEPPTGTRTGLFVIALRPIEYEANPIAQYPTTLDGDRGVHNGDIVEATAVTLLPYPDLGDPTELRLRRAHAAKEIFVDRVTPGLVTDALPIAMVAIDRGRLVWVDPHLVRRELGAEAGDILGVTGAPLALREAFMLQYDDHLREVLRAVHGAVVASDHFLALPPAGAMPKSSIDRQRFTQRFFPAEVDVDLSVVPSDELGALLEEARLLPPIDLSDPDELAGTSVLVLVPVDRSRLDSARAQLVGKRRALPAVAPNLLARKRPLERLVSLPLLRQPLSTSVPALSAEDKAWRALLDLDSANDVVWYVRRRSLSRKPTTIAELFTPPDSLQKLAESLKDHGVTEQDAGRIQPLLWDVASDAVIKLYEKSKLGAASALVELAGSPPFTKVDEAKAWAEYVVKRSTPPGQDTKGVQAVFKAGRPVTAVLVRAGLLADVTRLAPDSRIGRDDALRAKWAQQVEEVENTPADLAVMTEQLRRLLLQLADLLDPQAPVEPDVPSSLQTFVNALAKNEKYDITARDARRIQPELWAAGGEAIVKLHARFSLFGAAALFELFQAPSVASAAEAEAWAKYLVERFAVAADTGPGRETGVPGRPWEIGIGGESRVGISEETARLLQATFTPARPVTAVLLRAGILHELAIPFSQLALDEKRLEAWTGHVKKAEKDLAEPARTERLRGLLFAVLDIQETTGNTTPPADRLVAVPAGVLTHYTLTDLLIDRLVWKAGLDAWVNKADATGHEGARLLAAAAVVELSDEGEVADPETAATALTKKYTPPKALVDASTGTGGTVGRPPGGGEEEDPVNEVLLDLGPVLARTRRVADLMGYFEKKPGRVVSTLVALDKEARKHASVDAKIKALQALIDDLTGGR